MQPAAASYRIRPNLKIELAKMTPKVRCTSEILFACDVARASRTNNFIAFFRLARKATYLQPCLMHAHFTKALDTQIKVSTMPIDFVILLRGLSNGKFGAIFASIPFPIFAALYCVFFGLVASVELSFLQFTNMNSMRNLIITGLSLFPGISVPQYFNDSSVSSGHGPVHTSSRWVCFNLIMPVSEFALASCCLLSSR